MSIPIFEYSPRPQAEYIKRIEGGALRSTAHWNLYWTLIPELDLLLVAPNVCTIQLPQMTSDAYDAIVHNPTVKRHATILALCEGNPKYFIDYLNEIVGIVEVKHLDIMEERLKDAYARYLVALPPPNNLIQFRSR